MLIGIPRESKQGETLVAATAKTVTQLTNLGYDVIVESGAGDLADQPDSAFTGLDDAKVRVGTTQEVWAADVVVKVNAPSDEEIGRLRKGATIISMMAPGRSPELLEKLQAQGVTALAMDAVPRISRAQSMDVLSSMANVAGYRAVVEAAHEFGRMFTGQVTAAGKIPPARVFVVGAGVAGLAAIGAASAMGAVVRAFDVRPEVAEQVESMGAQFVHVDMEQEVSSDGYAKEMSAAQVAATAAMYDEEARAADIVITTALIPGRPAPSLLTAETVAGMRNGSVIVDMAAANGGNAAGTVADQKVVTANGVTILGYTDLAGRLAAQTSQLYGTNIVNLLKLLTPEKDGQLGLDFDDVVQRGITVVHNGEGMWPPPAVTVSAAPAAAAAAPAPVKEPKAPMAAGTKVGLVLGGIGLFWLVNALAPTDELRRHFTVLMLSIVIGYYVIGKVAHALHTPLMSVTNAISGVVVVGALLQVPSNDNLVLGLSLVAILLASINVFGGFAVTRRMLSMFSKGA
ncbi:Re/Si-specific NAD(P)(+) transhydrogenase subunit alpha [Nocardioides daeguensis]|uniref:proton-translocating NAD(P)(+) transhydrogenase n=1 Tax=Nocardioides daeguensis TaxID=908359 RepID=A0ABP6V8G7_9ACTN|nr:Re/Si-specific NAD(P)(+) transhydrogenase subunit alpha [Nocardioides daeguensis]MBV6726431.1 Re/Si-specific NAD(P)(+) transhydrogenase subunit alpha [Nocardioides daeguensis]MCR1772274.1 Re/Si-specific NAD(P)(+) transhydrogenase subunit alpha [Nocardioides daeguensis]